MIREENGKYCLYTKDGGELIGCHDTREGALAQERAIYANKAADADDAAERADDCLDPMIPIEVVEKCCPECAGKMRKYGLTKARRSKIVEALLHKQGGMDMVNLVLHIDEQVEHLRPAFKLLFPNDT